MLGRSRRAVNCVLKLPIPATKLLKFCRKFTVPLRAALRDAGCWRTETPKRRLCMYSLLHQAVAILVTHTAAIIRRSIWAFRA
ncbi:MAG: hypothetical protein ACLRP3_08855 [Escherichia sp.]